MRVAALLVLSSCRGLLGFEEASLAPSDVAAIDPDAASPLLDGAAVDMAGDAPAFDPATECPSTYAQSFPGQTSRYRTIVANRPWQQHQTECADDLPGKTHLIVFDNAAEIAALQAQPRSGFQVGWIQLPDQATADANWFAITGEPVDPTLWLAGQPNDNNATPPVVENNEQNRAFINYLSGSGVQDSPASFQDDAICECDGKPIPPAIASML